MYFPSSYSTEMKVNTYYIKNNTDMFAVCLRTNRAIATIGWH